MFWTRFSSNLSLIDSIKPSKSHGTTVYFPTCTTKNLPNVDTLPDINILHLKNWGLEDHPPGHLFKCELVVSGIVNIAYHTKWAPTTYKRGGLTGVITHISGVSSALLITGDRVHLKNYTSYGVETARGSSMSRRQPHHPWSPWTVRRPE